jgi:pSer/pThr/pTyr-binding forkhead associated (FHA) protein
MARLILKDSDGSLRSLDLGFSVSRIGRAPDNDLMIDHFTVSLHHCEVFLEGAGLTIRDLKSTNGTFLDGQPVTGSVTVTCAQRLHLGRVELLVEYADVHVVIPEFKKTVLPPVLVAPATGKSVCLRHQDRQAVWKCPRCAHLICTVCIHRIRRKGGRTLYLCPDCSSPADLLPEFAQEKKRSLLGRLKAGVGKSASAVKKFLEGGPTAG